MLPIPVRLDAIRERAELLADLLAELGDALTRSGPGPWREVPAILRDLAVLPRAFTDAADCIENFWDIEEDA